MQRFLTLVLIAFMFGACDNANTPNEKGLFLGGRLVFQNGEIHLSPETVDMVCYSEQGEDWVINILLNEPTADELFRLTSENVEGEMSLIKGDYTYFTATIREPLPGPFPIQLVILSGAEKTKEEISALFGFPGINQCEEQD